MSQTLSYIIQINSNFDKSNAAFNKFSTNVLTGVEKIQRRLNSVSMNAFIQNMNAAADGISSLNDPGMKLSSSLAELKAITGIAGKGLKEIEGYARESAKTFGGSAADGVESYKLLLSQLSPELAKQPKALKAMGDNVAILSKQMGGDNAAAAEVLTTAMNQFGVSLDDPLQASKDMSAMMNIMSKSAADGSAELPALKAGLEQSGLAAKTSNISFAESVAALQVLDKAGKKSSEGGVAFRNVMATLAEGRFLPKEVQAELKAAGVDINALTDKSKTFKERLDPLNKIMNDQALVTKLFGKENSAAAIALIQGRDAMDSFTKSSQGTTDALRQAADIMDSPLEKNKRLQAQIDDFKISLFNGTNGWLGYANVIGNTTRDFSNMLPLFSGAGKVLATLTSATKLQALWTGAVSTATGLWTGIQSAFNVVMAMNPIVLIVLAVVALIAAIVLVASKTEGWGKMWKHTINGAKLLFMAYIEAVKANFNTMVNVFMMGIDKIQIAWYKFKNAVGLGDKNANNAEIAKLNQDVEARKESIKAGYKKAASTAIAGAQEFVKAYDSVKWKKDDPKKANSGIAAAGVAGTDFGKGGATTAGTGDEAMKKSNEAVATGGTKHNYYTITIKELIGLKADNVGSGKDTAEKAGEGVADQLLRVLASASSSTG